MYVKFNCLPVHSLTFASILCVCFTKICRCIHAICLFFFLLFVYSDNQTIIHPSNTTRNIFKKTSKSVSKNVNTNNNHNYDFISFHFISFLKSIAIHYLLVGILERLYREIRYVLTRSRLRYVLSSSVHSLQRMRRRGEIQYKK